MSWFQKFSTCHLISYNRDVFFLTSVFTENGTICTISWRATSTPSLRISTIFFRTSRINLSVPINPTPTLIFTWRVTRIHSFYVFSWLYHVSAIKQKYFTIQKFKGTVSCEGSFLMLWHTFEPCCIAHLLFFWKTLARHGISQEEINLTWREDKKLYHYNTHFTSYQNMCNSASTMTSKSNSIEYPHYDNLHIYASIGRSTYYIHFPASSIWAKADTTIFQILSGFSHLRVHLSGFGIQESLSTMTNVEYLKFFNHYLNEES